MKYTYLVLSSVMSLSHGKFLFLVSYLVTKATRPTLQKSDLQLCRRGPRQHPIKFNGAVLPISL